MPADDEVDIDERVLFGIIAGLVIGVAICCTLWAISQPHFDATPDLELNPCMGWGTTNGQEFPTPSDKWYDATCPNRTGGMSTNLPLYKMYDEERCRCYEYKNWWKFVKPFPSMFR